MNRYILLFLFFLYAIAIAWAIADTSEEQIDVIFGILPIFIMH